MKIANPSACYADKVAFTMHSLSLKSEKQLRDLRCLIIFNDVFVHSGKQEEFSDAENRQHFSVLLAPTWPSYHVGAIKE